MTIQLKSVFLSAALAAMILPVAAQNSSTTTPSATKPPSTVSQPPSAITPTPKPPTTQKPVRDAATREENQQDRIAHGIQDGQLTPEEASKLEKQEGTIKKETEAARADGTVTAAERAKVKAQQNELSQEIKNQKHDAQKSPNTAEGPVATRKQNQQDRIAKGVADGQISPDEASKLEKQENHFNQETKRLHEKNSDGQLTDEQKKKLNHQQQRLSNNIHHAKTNGNGNGKGR